nr:response regulator transcription factor [Sphingobium nicotianae]
MSALVQALRNAHVQPVLAVLPRGPAGLPRHALIWQWQDDSIDRASALSLGALDGIGPWMPTHEALARCLRFVAIVTSLRQGPETQMQLGELEIDLIEREARRQGRTLGLLQREFELLNYLATCPDQPHSREALLRAVWRLGFDPGTNVVEVHVSRLRARLDRGFAWPMLRTVRGAGYALVTGALA